MGGPERSSILHVPIQAKKGFRTTHNVRDLADRVVEVRRHVWICLNDFKPFLGQWKHEGAKLKTEVVSKLHWNIFLVLNTKCRDSQTLSSSAIIVLDGSCIPDKVFVLGMRGPYRHYVHYHQLELLRKRNFSRFVSIVCWWFWKLAIAWSSVFCHGWFVHWSPLSIHEKKYNFGIKAYLCMYYHYRR